MIKRKKTVVQLGLLLIAAVFIIVGCIRGEAATVLKKAVNICFECIGLG